MFIPGIAISIITFPGVIVHEAAHMLFCKLRKVAVFDVKFFQFDANVAGYVFHEEPADFASSFLISMGPFLVNSLLCIVICFPASISIYVFEDMNFVSAFLLWLGVSIGMHAFPSNQDAKIIWEKAKGETRKKNLFAILSFPLVILVYLANILRFVWFDTIYGVFIGIVLPGMLFQKIL